MAKASLFRMGHVQLVELNYGVNESFDSEKFKEGISLAPELITELTRYGDGKSALVALTVIISKKNSKKNPIWFKAKNRMSLEWANDFEGDIDQFLTTTGTFHLLSFLRPLVTQLTTMSLLPPLILPLMDISDLKAKEIKVE